MGLGAEDPESASGDGVEDAGGGEVVADLFVEAGGGEFFDELVGVDGAAESPEEGQRGVVDGVSGGGEVEQGDLTGGAVLRGAVSGSEVDAAGVPEFE
jgi:hypothetical protein